MKETNAALTSDIREVLSDERIPLERLKSSKILITGAAGIVGGTLFRTLSAINLAYSLDMQFLLHGRNESKLRMLTQADENAEIIQGDICDERTFSSIPYEIDAIIHCAAITKSSEMVSKPVEVISTMIDGTRNMLELARTRNCQSFVYTSSMEVYGQTSKREVREDDLGYLDLLSPRSCYPESKRLCEALCAAYSAQYGVPAKIARLAQTFGAGVSENETRVFAQFAKSALKGEDIVLHTHGNSRGNYCYLMDAVRGILTILLKGSPGEAYNVANPQASSTIREIAGVAAEVLGGSKCKVKVSIPADISSLGYAPDTDFVMNVDKIYALGWKPKYGLDAMFERMAAHWLETR